MAKRGGYRCVIIAHTVPRFMDIYVQKNGQQQGPFPETKIREGIDAGEFKPDDLAWTVGKASWQPLSALINLEVDQPPPIHSERSSTTLAEQQRIDQNVHSSSAHSTGESFFTTESASNPDRLLNAATETMTPRLLQNGGSAHCTCNPK